MLEWTYNELKESIIEDLNDLEKDSELKYSAGQVAGRCFYENTVVISEGYTESIIVHTVIGKYIIEKCTDESIKSYSNKLRVELEHYDRWKLDKSLTIEQIRELEADIEMILERVENLS